MIPGVHAGRVQAAEERASAVWKARSRYAEHVMVVDVLMGFEAELAAWKSDKVRRNECSYRSSFVLLFIRWYYCSLFKTIYVTRVCFQYIFTLTGSVLVKEH